ncbi:MAG: phosphate ABC transporter ATP-binding protein [Anaerolineae bacterium]|nr:phosphate ABC transporter ATP-binding protein [Anaerolineae bacterium]
MSNKPSQSLPDGAAGHVVDMVPKMCVDNLSLSAPNGAELLNNVSLTIPPGNITSLVGPSGSGKSTLLRCLNRLWEPPPGTVQLDGQDITALDVLTLRRRVGLLTQSGALFEGSVADNVAYGPGLHNQRLSQDRLTELLEMAGLDPGLAGKSTDTLSGGQAQRVALARTLANEPEVLLLDEPTSALDPAAMLKVEQTILSLRDRLGLTVVWVSHALEQVERTADFVALLVDGQILETGTPQHLLSGVHRHLTEDFAAGKLVSRRRGT